MGLEHPAVWHADGNGRPVANSSAALMPQPMPVRYGLSCWLWLNGRRPSARQQPFFCSELCLRTCFTPRTGHQSALGTTNSANSVPSTVPERISVTLAWRRSRVMWRRCAVQIFTTSSASVALMTVSRSGRS
jgi:hypothetical protein